MNLDALYLNPSSSAYLAGVTALYRVAKKQYPSITLKQVQQYLSTKDVHTLHKPVRHRFPRNRVYTTGIDVDWQADLVDFRALKKYNKGHPYILICIDVLSKYIWTVPLLNKRPSTVVKAFKIIFNGGRRPWRLCTDSGNEWKGEFKTFMKECGITHFFATSPDVKASVAERAVRTVKGRLWKHFTLKSTFKYTDILPQITAAINSTVCRSTGFKPVNVTVDNEEQVKAALFGTKLPDTPRFKYKVGDHVRISKERKRVGEKGYLPNYTLEVFRIASRLQHRRPATYRLEDLRGEPISGVFYEPELSRVYKRTSPWAD